MNNGRNYNGTNKIFIGAILKYTNKGTFKIC